MDLQGKWSEEEWNKLNVFQLESLHLLRTCDVPDYEAPESILELILRMQENKN